MLIKCKYNAFEFYCCITIFHVFICSSLFVLRRICLSFILIVPDECVSFESINFLFYLVGFAFYWFRCRIMLPLPFGITHFDFFFFFFCCRPFEKGISLIFLVFCFFPFLCGDGVWIYSIMANRLLAASWTLDFHLVLLCSWSLCFYCFWENQKLFWFVCLFVEMVGSLEL